MPRCDTCGNDYPRAFKVVKDGTTYTFDSFECAIHKLAPRCTHCGCTVIGHGLEAEDRIYCCAHCARRTGVESLVDNA
jgi:Rieske Fe-S protein